MADHIHFGEAIAKADEPVQNNATSSSQPEAVTHEFDELIAKRHAFEEARAAIHKEVNRKFTDQNQLPSKDEDVKKKLREYGHPICLFGEGKYERRERLRGILQGDTKEVAAGGGGKPGEEVHELFFTLGEPELKKARMEVADYSIAQSRKRLQEEREAKHNTTAFERKNVDVLTKIEGTMATELSQVGDERPLTQGKFDSCGKTFATAGWTGLIKLWNVDDGKEIQTLRGSDNTRCHGIAFKPGTEVGRHVLAAGFANNKLLVFNTGSTENNSIVGELKGHEDRVNRVAFHPNGNLLASTSHDMTWRLWDVETQKELLLQEGHTAGTYGLCFHPDGSLVCTTDLGGVVRLWDCRTGRSVIPLQGHYNQVLSCDFNKYGYVVATAADDNTVRLWDIRKRKCATTVLAHNKSISEVQFDPTGHFFMTSSYDKSLKIWSSVTYQCKKVLVGHEARVMSASICPSSTEEHYTIGSVAYDRTFKLWSTRG